MQNKRFEKDFNFKNQFLHASEIDFGDLKKPLENLSHKKFTAPLFKEYEDILENLRKEKNGN